MTRNVYVVGYPKTGTTWLCRLLGDVLNSPVGAAYKPVTDKCIAAEGANRPGEYYIGHGHLEITNESPVLQSQYNYINLEMLRSEYPDDRVIHIYRDPRDVIVSVNHHWGIDDIKRTIKMCAQGLWPIVHGGGLVNFYRQWLNQDDVPTVTYEQLHKNAAQELTWILQHLGKSVPHWEIRESVERQSFRIRKAWTEKQPITGLNYGREYQLRFLRKGIVGDWLNVMTDEEIALCAKHFGDLISELGYDV